MPSPIDGSRAEEIKPDIILLDLLLPDHRLAAHLNRLNLKGT